MLSFLFGVLGAHLIALIVYADKKARWSSSGMTESRTVDLAGGKIQWQS